MNQDFVKKLRNAITAKEPISLDVWQQCSKYSHMRYHLLELFKTLTFTEFQHYILDLIPVCSESESTVFCSIIFLIFVDENLSRLLFQELKLHVVMEWIYTLVTKLGSKYHNVLTTLISTIWYIGSSFVSPGRIRMDDDTNVYFVYAFKILEFALLPSTFIFCKDVAHDIGKILGLCSFYSTLNTFHNLFWKEQLILNIFSIYERIIEILSMDEDGWLGDDGKYIRHDGLKHLLCRIKELESVDLLLLFTPWAFLFIHASRFLQDFARTHGLRKLLVRITAHFILIANGECNTIALTGFKKEGFMEVLFCELSSRCDRELFTQIMTPLPEYLRQLSYVAPRYKSTVLHFPTFAEFLTIYIIQCRFPSMSYSFMVAPWPCIDLKHPVEDLYFSKSFHWLLKCRNAAALRDFNDGEIFLTNASDSAENNPLYWAAKQYIGNLRGDSITSEASARHYFLLPVMLNSKWIEESVIRDMVIADAILMERKADVALSLYRRLLPHCPESCLRQVEKRILECLWKTKDFEDLYLFVTKKNLELERLKVLVRLVKMNEQKWLPELESVYQSRKMTYIPPNELKQIKNILYEKNDHIKQKQKNLNQASSSSSSSSSPLFLQQQAHDTKIIDSMRLQRIKEQEQQRSLHNIPSPTYLPHPCRYQKCKHTPILSEQSYVIVHCTEKCTIHIHYPQCYRRLQLQSSCLTPDCDGKLTTIFLIKEGCQKRELQNFKTLPPNSSLNSSTISMNHSEEKTLSPTNTVNCKKLSPKPIHHTKKEQPFSSPSSSPPISSSSSSPPISSSSSPIPSSSSSLSCSSLNENPTTLNLKVFRREEDPWSVTSKRASTGKSKLPSKNQKLSKFQKVDLSQLIEFTAIQEEMKTFTR